MKNLLIIAYYFPPSGGPGVQRVLKHVQYLPEFGWNPIVLTVENGQFPARDESLLEKIPPNIPVYRTHIFEPYDLYRTLTGKSKDTAIDVNVIHKDNQKLGFKEKIAEFIRSTFFIPDARIGWKFTANSKAMEIIQKHNINAIYSSSPPYTCSIIARYVKRQTGLPWIAGFRDPWTGFISSPKRWLIPKKIDEAMEYSVFNEADFVECAWQGIIKDALSKYPLLHKEKFFHVPNGFDSADFPHLKNMRNDKFTLTYTGSLYGRRNPSSLFAGIEKLLALGKIHKSDFCLKFIGRFGAEVLEMFEKATFKDSIEIISYMPHEKSIEELFSSDSVLLIVDESKESKEIVPGKVYEYIGSKKPVLAIGPTDGAVAELIIETKSGRIAHQNDVDIISEIFLEYINNWKNPEYKFYPDLKAIEKYERKNSAKILAELLDRV
jgi:hypothetical protein